MYVVYVCYVSMSDVYVTCVMSCTHVAFHMYDFMCKLCYVVCLCDVCVCMRFRYDWTYCVHEVVYMYARYVCMRVMYVCVYVMLCMCV